jgi:UPF0755 protein
MFKNKKTLAYVLVIVSTLAATFSFYLWQVANSPNLNVGGKENYVLYIQKNDNYEDVLKTLRKDDMIKDDVSFGLLTKRMNYRDHVKPGRYEIKPDAGNKKFISKLRSGDQDPVKLTFNNVRTKADLIEKIDKKLLFDSNKLLAMLNDTNVCKKYGFNKETIMCMFLPDTYFVYWDATEEAFLDRMKKEYDNFWNGQRIDDAHAINMSPVEIGTLASIVQSETNKVDEMPKVAAVYINRIAQGMPLQADPTVKFAVGDFSIKRILTKHLNINSPYNTYRNLGLPPGPIALPERAALKAVLNYEKSDNIFFCAKEDFSGYHNFAANLSDHNINAKKYHDALNQRGIMK